MLKGTVYGTDFLNGSAKPAHGSFPFPGLRKYHKGSGEPSDGEPSHVCKKHTKRD